MAEFFHTNYVSSQIIHVHQLNFQENLETKIFRLSKGCVIHFTLGPSLFGKKVHLYCNHPPVLSDSPESSPMRETFDIVSNPLDDSYSKNFKTFERGEFYELEWVKKSAYTCDDTDLYAELELGRSGTFRYFYVICDDFHERLHPLLKDRKLNEAILCRERARWIEHRQITLLSNDEDSDGSSVSSSSRSQSSLAATKRLSILDLLPKLDDLPKNYRFPFSDDTSINVEDFEGDGSGFILVDPTLLIGPSSDPMEVPLNAVRCQTLLAKSLGRFDQWRARIYVTVQSGYNAIHLTPVQELGISDSAYCIKDHFKLNSGFYVPIEAEGGTPTKNNETKSKSKVSGEANPHDTQTELSEAADMLKDSDIGGGTGHKSLAASKMASPEDSEVNLVKLGAVNESSPIKTTATDPKSTSTPAKSQVADGKSNKTDKTNIGSSYIDENEILVREDDQFEESSPETQKQRSRSMSLSKSGRRTATMQEMESLVSRMNVEWGLLSFQDVVWNHAATNCEWIWEHPECGYNLINSPYLKPAYLLDRALWNFTLEVNVGSWAHRNVPPQIRDEFNLNAIRAILLDTIFPKLKIYEFYLADVDKIVDAFREKLKRIGNPNPKENIKMHSSGGQKKDSVRSSKSSPNHHSSTYSESDVKLIPDSKFRRMQSSVDMRVAIAVYNREHGADTAEHDRVEYCCNDLRNRLYALNHTKWEEIENNLKAAAEAVLNNARYYFLDGHGPKWAKVTMETPIVYKYFTHPFDDLQVEREEVEIINNPEKGQYVMAHNGWVMNDDPLRNFAGPDSFVFLRRELIVWGDNVKLRYGDNYDDNPFLWETMKNYTEQVAKMFHGIRIDNCHSTPLSVGEYLIDSARRVRPNLYVMAELFTQSEATDNIFVNRFGITTLIREAMTAWNAKELGRLVHRYGGTPVGSFLPPPTRRLLPVIAHAIFMDQTHDNPSIIEAKSPFDVLPLCAIVSMSCCSTGSTRGVDEMFPNKIDIVNDNRKYKFWTDKEDKIPHKAVCMGTGIIAAKRVLNHLHQEMALDHYDQIFVDQIDDEVVAITRHSPLTHKSIIMVAFTVFHNIGPALSNQGKFIRPLTVPGVVEEIIMEAKVEYCPEVDKVEPFKQDARYLNGLNNYKLRMRTNIHFYGSEMIEYHETGQAKAAHQEIDFVRFSPGSVIILRVNLNTTSRTAVLALRQSLSEFGYNPRSFSGTEIVFDPKSSSFSKLILSTCTKKEVPRDEKHFEILSTQIVNDIANRENANMTDTDIRRQYSKEEIANFLTQIVNKVLYKCDPEERSDTDGKIGVYDIPNYGNFVYCGLMSVASLLKDIRLHNDLGHALCENLRKGDWLPAYISSRLKEDPHTLKIGEWFERAFSQLTQIPRYLIPFYFEALINGAFRVIIDTTTKSLSRFINRGTPFTKRLSISSMALVGNVKSALMPLISTDAALQEQEKLLPSISAGLPHFSQGIFRTWGRDTFIALRGLLLLTGRFVEARFIILSFARTLRHGLIPNLLGEGKGARYNCRDAVWWWLQSIQDYCETMNYLQISMNDYKLSDQSIDEINDTGRKSENYSLLNDKVSRMYPTDDSPYLELGICEQPLCDVIQEALQKHAQGLQFRERNAGPGIDSNMSDQGFNNSIGVDWETGFVYGGNKYNCGTWMDKMGSSDLAHNKGVPATPRDGSAVEIVALCKSTTRWLNKLHKAGLYPHGSVKVSKNNRKRGIWNEQENSEPASQDKNLGKPLRNANESDEITFEEWDSLILKNFEKCFWVPSKSKIFPEGYEIYDTDGHRRLSIATSQGNSQRPVESTTQPADDQGHMDLESKLLSDVKYANRHCIYKDTFGSCQPWTDFQLRCNFPVAMAIAPELFSVDKAWKALKIAQDVLLGPLGIKTLDPTDWAYCGFYDNDNNSADYKVAHGFNYHQGPEWLWPVGYFFRSKLYFARALNPNVYKKTETFIRESLAPHYKMLKKPPWFGLPELTQENGKECVFGCYIQAWSTSTILETLFDMRTCRELDPNNSYSDVSGQIVNMITSLPSGRGHDSSVKSKTNDASKIASQQP